MEDSGIRKNMLPIEQKLKFDSNLMGNKLHQRNHRSQIVKLIFLITVSIRNLATSTNSISAGHTYFKVS